MQCKGTLSAVDSTIVIEPRPVSSKGKHTIHLHTHTFLHDSVKSTSVWREFVSSTRIVHYLTYSTWPGSAAGCTVQQTLELHLLDILNLEALPRHFPVFEHRSPDAFALLHHRSYCRVQTGLYPICKTTRLLCITNYKQHLCWLAKHVECCVLLLLS